MNGSVENNQRCGIKKKRRKKGGAKKGEELEGGRLNLSTTQAEEEAWRDNH